MSSPLGRIFDEELKILNLHQEPFLSKSYTERDYDIEFVVRLPEYIAGMPQHSPSLMPDLFKALQPTIEDWQERITPKLYDS